MNTIFLDMDGVVADFDSFVTKLLGREISWHANHDLSTEEWDKLASVDRLYYNLELMPNATKLVGFCKSLESRYRVQFLTAIPRRTTMPTAEDDKREWVNKYFPGMKMDIGPYSGDKWKWCKPGDILIDDRPSNITDWSTKGTGIAIYHEGNVQTTINTLIDVIEADKGRRRL